MKNLGKGIRHLSAEEAKDVDLGPLAQLPGTWVSPVIDSKLVAPGWNVISVPGAPKGFVFEVIPYTETLTFSPVVIAADNRGPIVNGHQITQSITGLMYEQKIISACTTDFCNQRGFKIGNEIHAETGLFLNLGSPNGSFSIARLATIPHGNSLLALGNSETVESPGNDFFSEASAIPTNLDGSAIAILGYTDPVAQHQQFPGVFNQSDPNSFLSTTLQSQNAEITEMTVLNLSTANKDAGGGILNIPFIGSNVNATLMHSTFWIESLKGQSQLQMQYSQTINLVFPSGGTAEPLVWPHITISTLVKKDN